MSDEPLPSVEEEASARAKFLIWFAEPFRILEDRGDGHGAFVALSIGLFLCERYFRYKSGTTDLWREEGFLAEAAGHYQTDYSFFKEFWNVYRHGMQDQGIPKADEAHGWDINDDYPPVPTRAFENDKAIICLNPWKFTEEMIVLCWHDPVALTKISNQSLGRTSIDSLKWEFVPPVESQEKESLS
jgi:hypothetical protein